MLQEEIPGFTISFNAVEVFPAPWFFAGSCFGGICLKKARWADTAIAGPFDSSSPRLDTNVIFHGYKLIMRIRSFGIFIQVNTIIVNQGRAFIDDRKSPTNET
jgi:hypothetical protein